MKEKERKMRIEKEKERETLKGKVRAICWRMCQSVHALVCVSVYVCVCVCVCVCMCAADSSLAWQMPAGPEQS